MLLVLTASDDITADFLCTRLDAEEVRFARLDTDIFSRDGCIEYQAGGVSLTLRGETITPAAIRSVWYRRPRGIVVEGGGTTAQLLHTSREWGASLDGFLSHVESKRWMNHPAANARAANKLHQLTIARNVGLIVPDTIVTKSAHVARAFWKRHRGRVIVKPLSVGYVETRDGHIEGRIFTSKLQAQHLLDDALLARCPSLIQEEVRDGLDVRVTIVDGRLTALLLRRHNRKPDCVDIRKGDMTELDYENVPVPERVAECLSRLMTNLDLRFGAADFIVREDGTWVFLEINPNGQWAWMDLLGVSDIAKSFVETSPRANNW